MPLPLPSRGRPETKASPLRVVVPVASVFAVALIGWALWPDATSDPNAIVVAGDRVEGWPTAVPPGAVVEPSRGAAGLEGEVELIAIRAELRAGGVVDVQAGSTRSDASPLSITYATVAETADLRAEPRGLRGPRRAIRGQCDGRPCGRAVPPPSCESKRLWETAVALGARPEDTLRAVYEGGESGPEWSLTIDERGTIVLDDKTCAPRSRERFRPPARPLATLPGAPAAVDPLEVLPLARDQAGLGPDSALLEIEASGIGIDGTIDFGEPEHRILFRFSDPGNLPIAQRRWRQVVVTSEGMPITPVISDREPLPPRVRGTVAAPKCTFGQVWSLALLPKQARTRIRYAAADGTSDGGLWTLESADGKSVVTHHDDACRATKLDAPGP